MKDPVTWVVGAGGLLGKHVAAELQLRGAYRMEPTAVPWHDPAAAQRQLTANAQALVEIAAGGAWRMIWCAGAGVTGSSTEELDHELDALDAVLASLSGDIGSRGTVFLASSAGGVYAGVGAPPYSENSPVAPLAPYGHAKLAAEARVGAWAAATGGRALVGRIANLYGPGQNLSKPQGLISQLCAGYLQRRPNHIWSSLDTIRDYIFAPDCAGLLLDAVERLEASPSGSTIVKILATSRGMTIGEVIQGLALVFHRRPQIVLGASPATALQAVDLSLCSNMWTDLDRRVWTPFPAAVLATLEDMRQRFAAEGLRV